MKSMHLCEANTDCQRKNVGITLVILAQFLLHIIIHSSSKEMQLFEIGSRQIYMYLNETIPDNVHGSLKEKRVLKQCPWGTILENRGTKIVPLCKRAPFPTFFWITLAFFIERALSGKTVPFWKVAQKWCPKRYHFTDDQTVPWVSSVSYPENLDYLSWKPGIAGKPRKLVLPVWKTWNTRKSRDTQITCSENPQYLENLDYLSGKPRKPRQQRVPVQKTCNTCLN